MIQPSKGDDESREVPLRVSAPASARRGVTRRARSGLVMVVDDDPEIRRAIRLLLPKQYEVIGLESGEEFLEMVQAYQPDLIILDIHLPGGDGFKLCKQLRSQAALRQIPVLFLTVLHEDTGLLKALEANSDAYLTKPFDPQELLDTIGRLIDATLE